MTIKTRNENLSLSSENSFTVKGSGLRLDLGRGAIISTGITDQISFPAGFTLSAENMAVYYTGATSGNKAIIHVGETGSFAFVTDLRGDATTTVGNTALSLTSFTEATSGLSLVTTGVLNGVVTVKTGIVGNQVTVSGLTSGANQSLSYIEGNSVTVSGAASTFSGGVLLRATESSLSLGVEPDHCGEYRTIC